jgi:hypothetical protein
VRGGALTAAALAARVDRLLADARAAGRAVTLRALEELYTTGCARVLELEADAVRLQRQREGALSAAPEKRPPDSVVRSLTADATEVREALSELRAQVRHIRTATEWLREESYGQASGL